MSFWSKFGKIAGIAGAGAASLATLGAASPALGAALGGIGMGGKVMSGLGTVGKVGGALSPVVGGIAKGRAEGRQAETDNLMAHDRMVQQAIQQEFANKLGLAGTEANMLDLRANQARHGDLQANVQDVHIPDNERVHIPHWTGGVRPSALGPNARAAGQRLSDTALAKMGNEGLPTAPVPHISPLPQAGFADKLLGAVGPALGIAGAFPQSPNQGATGGPQRMGMPGAPILSPGDLGFWRQNNPKLLPPGQFPEDDQNWG